MTSADLEGEFERAWSAVRQPHLDRIRALGVPGAALAHIGCYHPPFGVMTGESTADGSFVPGDGPARIVQPVAEGGELVDMVAWRSTNPTRWSLRTGLGWLLNADAFVGGHYPPECLCLVSTPLEWLRAGGVGAVVVDWSSSELWQLRCFDAIQCSDDMLAATLRKALTRPQRLPVIETVGVRHAA